MVAKGSGPGGSILSKGRDAKPVLKWPGQQDATSNNGPSAEAFGYAKTLFAGPGLRGSVIGHLYHTRRKTEVDYNPFPARVSSSLVLGLGGLFGSLCVLDSWVIYCLSM